ncbi:MAG: TetR/AcrR family transcriptional regulator [Pseudomonadota bacterium]
MKPKIDIDDIYRAALGVFAEYGFKKATLDDIAARLGMTKGNLYRYARNKKDLYEQTARHALLRWQSRVREAVSAETDPAAQFLTMSRTAVDILAGEADLRRLLVRDPDIFPMFPTADPYADINANSVDMIRDILAQGIAEGRFRPVDLNTVPEILFSIYKMFIIRMYLQSGDPSVQEMFAQTVALMTRGLFVDTNGAGD